MQMKTCSRKFFVSLVVVVSLVANAAMAADLMTICPIGEDTPVVGYPFVIVVRFDAAVDVAVVDNEGNVSSLGSFLNNAPDSAGYSFGRITWTPLEIGTYHIQLTPAAGGAAVEGSSFTVVDVPTQPVYSSVVNPVSRVVFPSDIVAGSATTWEVDFPLGSVSSVLAKFDDEDWTQPNVPSSVSSGLAMFSIIFSTPTSHTVQFKTTGQDGEDVLSAVYSFVVGDDSSPITSHALSFYLDRALMAGTSCRQIRDILHVTGDTVGTNVYRVLISERSGITTIKVRYKPNKLVLPPTH
jgi:hypothetical protein